MKTRIIGLLAGSLLCGAFTTVSAMAQERPNSINTRQHQQQLRIRQGIQSGELTHSEAARLERQEAQIRVNERFARRDGFTPAERLRVQKSLNRTSRHINHQKHDNQAGR